MSTNSYRNPNEAIDYLRAVRDHMAKLVDYNVVSIATSTTKSRVKVINLSDVESKGSSAPSIVSTRKTKTYDLTRTSDAIPIPRTNSFGDGDFQKILRVGREYKESMAIYRDLTDKRAEWSVLWSSNPHLERLLIELEATMDSIREALISLRRRMHTAAKHFCPTRVLNIVSDIEKFIYGLPSEKVSKSIEVTFPDETDPTLVNYRFAYKLTKLKTHSTKVLQQYIIAINYVVDLKKKVATGHLSTMIEFDPNADIGGSFKTPEQGIDLLNTYMDLDRLDVNPGVMPFPTIPSLNKDSIGVDAVETLDVDPDTHRLYVRTSRFLDAEEQEDVLHGVLKHMPDYLKHGQLRIDIAVEAFCELTPITDRNKRAMFISAAYEKFENANVRHLGNTPTSELEVSIKTIGFKQANIDLPQLKRFLVGYPGVTPKRSGVRNVFSFAVGAGKRSDVRSLRKFIDSISEELPPESVLKVRKALGV